MTFEQIGYFLALAQQKSFVRAARRCGISQPSLSNAIKSLEAALGAPLFERALAGSELTAFGRHMHPLLAQLYEDRLRVFAVASSSSCALNPIADLYSRKKRLHSEPEQAGHIANLKRRTVAVLTGLLAFALVAIGTRAEARDRGVELLIRESLPMPVRCSRTLEPLFYCRHETPSEHSVVLDLTNSLDGPSASLTYDYNDQRSDQLRAVVRHFFVRLGVPANVFDDCMAQWRPASGSMNGYKMLCYRVELGDRVTEWPLMNLDTRSREGGPSPSYSSG